MGRHILTTRQCYCILSRLQFFELHFGVLNSIFTVERLERLTKRISVLDLETLDKDSKAEGSEENGAGISLTHVTEHGLNDIVGSSQFSLSDSTSERAAFRVHLMKTHFRVENDEADTEEASFHGQEEFPDHNDILEWAKAHNQGSLQIICQYYWLACPASGFTITFHPLEHLQPLEFHRPDLRVGCISDSSIDLRSYSKVLKWQRYIMPCWLGRRLLLCQCGPFHAYVALYDLRMF